MTSPSASPPSEGEIVESDSEKATTAIASTKGTSVDRPFRTRVSVSRTPSPTRSSMRCISRTPSRSPYRENRGAKRALGNDHYDQLRNDPRRFRVRYEDYQPSDRGKTRNKHHNANQSFSLDVVCRDGERDRNGRQHERQPGLQNQSSAHKAHRLNGENYKGQELGGRASGDSRREQSRREYDESRSKLSIEQSVSDRGYSPVAAVREWQEAEFRNNQTQPADKPVGPRRDLTANSHTLTTESSSEGERHDLQSRPLNEAEEIEERRKKREAIKAKHRGQATPVSVASLALAADSVSATQNVKTLVEDTHPLDSPRIPSLQVSKHCQGQDSPTDFVVHEDADLANRNTAATGPAQEDEPSAADYDPIMDMQEDKIRHDQHQRKDEVSIEMRDGAVTTSEDDSRPRSMSYSTAAERPREDGFDMFAETDDLDMFSEAPTVPLKPLETISRAELLPQAKALDMSMLDDWDDPEGYYKVILGELLDNRYHVQSNLGKGMFSGVVRATDQITRSLVAIKLIRNNETMKKAGLKEIDILRRLSHADPEDKKHLIRLERSFEHKGHLCMVFENLSINLREVLKKFGRDVGINLRAVRAYAQQLFLGLGLLRKCNLLHADLKPDNILVNESRNVLKICDLGSASDASENEITQYLVSRFYRAPEIILGMPYDFSIDMWSIGCTLFELYTGKILFTGRSNNQMLRAIMECRGKFSHKILRKAQYTGLHFDDLLNFRSVEKDKLTGKDIVRILNFNKPVRDLKTRLTANLKGADDAELKELLLFVDLLERCLNLNPEKRCTPTEALRHPFILKSKV